MFSASLKKAILKIERASLDGFRFKKTSIMFAPIIVDFTLLSGSSQANSTVRTT